MLSLVTLLLPMAFFSWKFIETPALPMKHAGFPFPGPQVARVTK